MRMSTVIVWHLMFYIAAHNHAEGILLHLYKKGGEFSH
jgi:hypothetical protein